MPFRVCAAARAWIGKEGTMVGPHALFLATCDTHRGRSCGRSVHAFRKSLKTAHAGQPSFLPCQSKPALPRKPGRAFAHLISPDEKRRLMNPRPSRLAIAF